MLDHWIIGSLVAAAGSMLGPGKIEESLGYFSAVVNCFVDITLQLSQSKAS